VDLVALSADPSVPPFEQVRAQLAAAIESGKLQPSVRLPTVRKVAADLGLAVNTVAKAYRQLELAGLIETRGRQGSFVAGRPSAKRASAVRAAQDFMGHMRELGIGNAEALAILQREVGRTP
jgi:DNA-binding transcriptional regulator YhcF (GntR family)